MGETWDEKGAPPFSKAVPQVFTFHKIFQVGQAHLPESAVAAQPGIHGLQWVWGQSVDAEAAAAALFDETGSAQEAQMFGNGCRCHLSSFFVRQPKSRAED
jgi:hypothetical protein